MNPPRSRLRPLLLPAILLVAMAAFFWLTPVISPYSPTAPKLSELTQAPSLAHPFGTDGLGRDQMTRVAVAGQTSATVALIAALIVMLLSLIAATITSVSGPRVAALVHGLIDVFLALPPLLVILTVAALKGGGSPLGVAVILGTFGWMQAARAAIEESSAVAASEYVAFARRAGIGRLRTLVRHILPGLGGSASAAFGTAFAMALLGEATLSFLGFGVNPPAPSLGRMIGEAGDSMLDYWWLSAVPGAAVVLLAIGAGGLGERARRVFDPIAAHRAESGATTVARDQEDLATDESLPAASTEEITRKPLSETKTDNSGLHISGVEVESFSANGRPGSDLLFLPRPIHVGRGRMMALVGASGSGKSTFARALTGLLPASLRVSASVLVNGAAPARGDIAMVPQDPYGAFVPGRSVLWHFKGLPRHSRYGGDTSDEGGDGVHHDRAHSPRRSAEAVAEEWLEKVGIEEPLTVMDRSAGTLSGGELQRSALALALASGPEAIVADEPTASLDSVTSRELLSMLRNLSADQGLPLIVATHEVDLISEFADDVLAISGGKALSRPVSLSGDDRADSVRAAGAGPLLEASLSLHCAPVQTLSDADGKAPLLQAHDISVSIEDRVIIHDIGLKVVPGELVAIVGRSGIGKTTLLKALDGWIPLATGILNTAATVMVPQNAARSMDPRMRVYDAIAEATYATKDRWEKRRSLAHSVSPSDAARLVALDPDLLAVHTLTLSGGEARRVAIARGLVAGASILLLDEPLAGLDPIAALEVMAMLRGLATEKGIGIVIVSHDIHSVALCDRILVMCSGATPESAGTIVEEGPAATVLSRPSHPATRALVEAAAGESS